MRVRICRAPAAAVNGTSMRGYVVGEVYDVRRRLADVFLREGWALPAPDAPTFIAAGSNRTIPLVLVIDDDVDVRQLTTVVLLLARYEVVQAEHGLEGIARLCEHAPDLVLLDLNMPIMSGREFRVAQRQLTDVRLARIPVVLVTADDTAERDGVAVDIAAVVTKPFTPEQLQNAVADV